MAKPRKSPASIREPVQVYLAGDDRALLDRVAKKAGVSRAEVLRRGVRYMAAEVLADESPMLAFIREQTIADWPADTPADASAQHDKYLTDRPHTLTKRSTRTKAAKRPKAAKRTAP